mgnify:CR=1 FL=1
MKFLRDILDGIKTHLTQKHSLAAIFKLVAFGYGSSGSVKQKKYQDLLTKITETKKSFKNQLIQKSKLEIAVFNEYQIKFTNLY